MIRHTRPLILPPLLLCLALLSMLSACAANLTGPERARIAGHELSVQYAALHRQYAEAHAALPEKQQDWLRTKAAPRLDSLKRMIIIYNDAAIAWSRGAEPEIDMKALLGDITTLLADTGSLILEATHD